MLIQILFCFIWLAPATVLGLSPISAKGTKLYDAEGNQFFIKGVVYQSARDNDVLVNTSQCQIDAGLMAAIGVNTIRVYSAASLESHDGCMQAFASQGIYIWLDIPTTETSINRVIPDWTLEIYTNWTNTLDTFAGYDNLLVFTVANEIINDDRTTSVAPYIKAAVRDIKAFRDARGYRKIPISYTTPYSDDGLPVDTADYLSCGDEPDALELFGINVYTWCGNSSYYASGFDKLYEQFQGLNIPVVFSETGCREQAGDFADVSTMLGPVFQAVFSGSIVYEWTMQDNGYGLVQYSSNDYTGFPETLDDYNALKTAFSTSNPTGTSKEAYTPSNTAPSCPTSASTWSVKIDEALPTIEGLDLTTVTARTTITTTTSSASTGVSTQTTGISNYSDTSTSTSSSDGISSGAIAGIVVAVAVIMIGVAVVAFFIIKRWRTRQSKQGKQDKNNVDVSNIYSNEGGYDGTASGFKAELPAQSTGRVLPRQELDAFGTLRGDKNSSFTDAETSLEENEQRPVVVYEMDGCAPAPGEPGSQQR
ncbi:Glucanosyltransferase-domain-containing protein [Biscogniauxia marginata]|nr:Glucanosyltransferase-domain-containing protein [Biscogniauxia marginata]